jgi:hypothetical protein
MSEDPWMQHMRRGDFESAWQISDALLSVRRDVCDATFPVTIGHVTCSTSGTDRRSKVSAC